MKNSKSQPNQPHSEPDKSSKDQYKRHVDGDITIRGQIETHFPPEYVTQQNTEREEDKATHNKNFWVGVLTLIAVTVYAGFTLWQVLLTRESIDNNTKQFQIDQ